MINGITTDQVRDVIERHSAWVIGNNRCFHNSAYEAIADELNAAMGGGECEMEYATEGMKRGWWVCSECGEASDTIESCAGRKPPNYCGNCGKAVKR